MNRGSIFDPQTKGVAFEVTERVWQAPPMSGWKEETCMLQSLAAATVAHVLDPRPGERILDMCSAPGGKSTHIAQLIGDVGEVLACDRSKSKVAKIADLASRLGFMSVKATKADATVSIDKGIFKEESFDRVLLDPPCSALGLRPSLRVGSVSAWSASRSRRSGTEELEKMPLYQRLMMRQAVKALKPGGCLVFSTCTLNPRENEGNVAWALKNLPLQLVPQDHARVGGSGLACQGLSEEQAAMLQRFSPGQSAFAAANSHRNESTAALDELDLYTGFFIACFRKTM
mmetsp:Transcript_16261/g.25253  ORF Transcript_16261/g.25253 Transcript_16261/m.25253 type:complete len:287 (+) Transcript_16261:183-1043(+)